MRTVTYRLVDLQNATLNLGHAGENQRTRIMFDAKKLFEEYPEALPSLTVKPPVGDTYPAVVTKEGYCVYWDITDSDLIHDGIGEAQLTFTENDVKVKTYITKTKITRSLDPVGQIPTPIENWIERADDILDEAQEATAAAESAAQHQPKIENGYWYVWNGTEYVQNVKAQGEDGAPGQDGKDGKDGADGQPGADGRDGVDATPALITVDYEDLVYPVAAGTTCYHSGEMFVAKEAIQTAGAWDSSKWDKTTVEEQVSHLLTAIHGATESVFDVSGVSKEITFDMDVHGWSAKDEYTVVKGHKYRIEIVSGYNISDYNLLVRVYDENDTAKLMATINETPFIVDSQYSGIKIAIGSLYNPHSDVVIRITDVTVSTIKNELDNVASQSNNLNAKMDTVDEIIDDTVYRTDDIEFGKSAGWTQKGYNLKKGNKYLITMHNISFPCTAYIRFYQTQNGDYYQRKDITTEQSASFEFVPEHNYSYVSVGLASAVTANVFLKIEYNLIKEEYFAISETNYPSAIINDLEINNNNGYNIKTYRSLYEKPFTAYWGGEYLAPYYNKLNGKNNILIALDGDSITAEGYRSTVIDDIFKAGGYYSRKTDGSIEPLHSLFNNGKGAASTVEWIGTGESYVFNGRTIPANGMLSESMAQNPDLLIIAFGTNDATLDINNTTIEERLSGLANRMEEGLKRIRGTSPVNGREAYGKSVNDLGVIICVPPAARTTGRSISGWYMYVQKLYAQLAREYQCAFIDFSIPTFDISAYNSLNKWGDIGISDPSVHPNLAFSKYYASILQPLIYPFGYWNYQILDDIPKSGESTDKPDAQDVYVGYSYYCTDINKPIYCSAKGTKAKCTFTVGTMSSDISQYNTGGIRLYIGDVSLDMMIINTVYVYAKAYDENKINEYMARYLCESLNARGYHSECNGATFTLYNDSLGEVVSYGFTDNVNYGQTNLPITCTLTQNGTLNEWKDANGNAVT